MFGKTRNRLATINTIMVFILLNLFGGIFYLYTYSRLYGRVDYSLSAVANHLRRDPVFDFSRDRDAVRQADRPVVYLLWSKDGQLLLQLPQDAFYASDVEKLRTFSQTQDFRTFTTADGHKYRSLAILVSMINGLSPGNPSRVVPVTSIQFVLNVDPEAQILADLVIIILVCDLVGGLISLMAGLFLARRALIPIKESWDKQQQFVADASHELRTPLTVVQGQLELLFRHPDNSIEQESPRISAVLTEVKRMSKLVGQLLTLARSDSNQLELDLKEFCLDDLLKQTTDQFRPLALTKQITLEQCFDHNMEFYGDRERIQQLLLILLDNSLKYTPERGVIKVSGHVAKHGFNISIEDTGIGIPEEDLPFIFDRFYRGDKVRARAGGGTGLGLAIAKWIVTAHLGSIWAVSKLSEGTRINIFLPLRRIR